MRPDVCHHRSRLAATPDDIEAAAAGVPVVA